MSALLDSKPDSGVTSASSSSVSSQPVLFPHVSEQELSNCFNPRERQVRIHQWRSAQSTNDENELILDRALNILGGVPIEMIHMADSVMSDNRSTRSRQERLSKIQERITHALEQSALIRPSHSESIAASSSVRIDSEMPSRISIDDSPISADQSTSDDANATGKKNSISSDLLIDSRMKEESDATKTKEEERLRQKQFKEMTELLDKMHTTQTRMVNDSDCMIDYLTKQGKSVEQCQRRLELELERFRKVLNASMVPLDHSVNQEASGSDLGYGMDGFAEFE